MNLKEVFEGFDRNKPELKNLIGLLFFLGESSLSESILEVKDKYSFSFLSKSLKE